MLSSRRATITGCFASHLRVISIHALLAESDPCSTIFLAVYGISIHALLAESDIDAEIAERERQSFLSTLSLRRATPDPASGRPARYISIHALLAESDEKPPSLRRQAPDFYPRSPCGERPLHFSVAVSFPVIFLSTLSLRRATAKCYKKSVLFVVKLAILPLPYAIFRDLSKSFQRFIHFKRHFFGAKTPGF